MEQYIPKSVVLAEIERRIKRFREEKDSVSIVKTNTYKGIFSFINALEVKEVNLDKEIKKYSMELAMKENNGDWLKDITTTAKHFFELGVAVSNEAQKGE